MGSLEYLKQEILKPVYCMCNECINLDNDGICKIYNDMPPKEILLGNKYREKNNLDVCKDFKIRS